MFDDITKVTEDYCLSRKVCDFCPENENNISLRNISKFLSQCTGPHVRIFPPFTKQTRIWCVVKSKYSVTQISLKLARTKPSFFQFVLSTIKQVEKLNNANDLYPHTDNTNTQQMMSYKIRANGASHHFGNLSILSVRQVYLIELRKCLGATSLYSISITARTKSRFSKLLCK